MEEITKFDKDSQELNENIQICNEKTQILELSDRQNTNKMTEIKIELHDTIERFNNAKASKQKEIENVEQRISSTENETQNIQYQIQDINNRLSEQLLLINALKTQLSDEEYSMKRRNTS